MKKIICLFFFLGLAMGLSLRAVEYKILKLSADSIKIGTRYCKRGAIFKDTETILWGKGYQYMWAQNLDNQKTYYFSHDAMQSKNTRTVKDYVLRLSKMSSKDGVAWQNLMGKNKTNFSEKRIALVIGNSNYQNNTQLRNPINDAAAVSNELQSLGFDVLSLYDGTVEDMGNVVEVFRRKAADEHYKIAFFYYSGHGLQDDGRNWLLPVDVALNSPADLRRNCVEGQWLLSKLAETECENTIVVLDACRNEKLNWTRGMTEGLVSMEPHKGMLLAYSTRAGEVAQDLINEKMSNGPYALALINSLRKQNLTLDEIFNDVKGQVIQYTMSLQSPIHINGAINSIYLNGKNATMGGFNEARRIQSATLDDLRLMAEEGNKDAQYRLGMMYEFGLEGLKQNYNEAVKWYSFAAQRGHDEAENKLGSYYFWTKDYTEALRWFKTAAQNGNINAQYNLGKLYMNSLYGVTDFKEGIKWLQTAADAGHQDAQFDLGLCYYNGIGVVQYRTAAVKYFNLAAEQDHAEAQYYLGQCYFKGEGVQQDYGEAVRYFQMAAEDGLPDAQYLLCYCYDKGLGVDQDAEMALKWCEKAAAQNHEKAKIRLPHMFQDTK